MAQSPEQRKSNQVQEPNLSIPLVSSYNTRNIDGDSNAITNALDQRKINTIYEPITNAGSNNTTIYLVKRPGVADLGSSYGTTGQVAHLVEVAPGATSLTATNHWVFSTSGNDIRASNDTDTTVILTSANNAPAYVDKGFIAGSDTLLIQIRNTSTAVQRVFYSTAIATFTEIVDADFTGLTIKGKMEMMDGYAFALSSTNRIYNSNLNTLGTWGTTSYIIKQMTQDIPTGLAKLNKFLLAFGQNTLEVFHNVGNPTGSPLELIAEKGRVGVGIDAVEGSGMRHYYSVHNNKLFFLGNSPKGLYVYDGNEIVKVSTPAIDKIIAGTTVYSVSKLMFSGKTGICLSLDLPSATTQKMLVFFPDWKDWFEWQSTVFQGVTSDRIGHTLLGVDASGHKLYKISQNADNWLDAGTSYTMTHQFGLKSPGNNIKRMTMCGVTGDTARAASSLNVYFSDDDGQNWSSARTIDMTDMHKVIHSCGAFRNRQVRLTHAGDSQCRLETFIARIQ